MEVIGRDTNGKSSQTNTLMDTTNMRSVSTNRATEDAASAPSADEVLYGVEECPPWYLCAFLSLQVGGFNEFRNISLQLFSQLCAITALDGYS